MKRSSRTPPSSRQSTEYWAPPLGDLGHVVGEQPLQEAPRPPGPLVSISPMCETSNTPALRAHRDVLLADALVLDRHLPAGERDEPRARRDVAVVQRRAAEGVCGGRQPPAGYPLSISAGASAVRRHWSTATASPSHPEKGRSGVCWARSTPRTPSGSRTSSTCAVTGSAGDMLRCSRQSARIASGAPPTPTPIFRWTRRPQRQIPSSSSGTQSCSPSTRRWPRRSMDAGAWWRWRARPASGSRAW